MKVRLRESFPETMLQLCETLVRCRGGGCPRRDTAALVTDSEYGILAAGYNGPPSKMVCTKARPCLGYGLPSGKSDVDGCIAIHGEENAVLRVAWPWRARYLFTIASPCMSCAKAWISLTSSQVRGTNHIYCRVIYPDPRALDLLAAANVQVCVMPKGLPVVWNNSTDLRALAKAVVR